MTGTVTREGPVGGPETQDSNEMAHGGVQPYPENEIALCGLPRGKLDHAGKCPPWIDPDRVQAAARVRPDGVLRIIAQLPRFRSCNAHALGTAVQL